MYTEILLDNCIAYIRFDEYKKEQMTPREEKLPEEEEKVIFDNSDRRADETRMEN